MYIFFVFWRRKLIFIWCFLIIFIHFCPLFFLHSLIYWHGFHFIELFLHPSWYLHLFSPQSLISLPHFTIAFIEWQQTITFNFYPCFLILAHQLFKQVRYLLLIRPFSTIWFSFAALILFSIVIYSDCTTNHSLKMAISLLP